MFDSEEEYRRYQEGESKKCIAHGLSACEECHAVIEFEKSPTRTFVCPVFGCTIPRGIPHEHPAGVSAVMRDPVAPLNADERAELESFRRERDWLTREGLKAFSKQSMYVVPEDAPIHAGRKLRDVLVQAGIERRPETEHQFATVWNGKEFVADVYGIDFGKDPAPAPRRTLAQSIGKFMAWMVSIPALLLAAFAIGTYNGWWV